MQACAFTKFCLGMCDWTDCQGSKKASTSSSATPGHTTILEHDLQQEVESARALTATD